MTSSKNQQMPLPKIRRTDFEGQLHRANQMAEGKIEQSTWKPLHQKKN
jgi:hypothetical protein